MIHQRRQITKQACVVIVIMFISALFYNQLQKQNHIASTMKNFSNQMALINIRISLLEELTTHRQSIKVKMSQKMKSNSKVSNQKYIDTQIKNAPDHYQTMKNSLLRSIRNDAEHQRSNVTNVTNDTFSTNNIVQTTNATNMPVNDFWKPEKQDFKQNSQKLVAMFEKKNKNHKTLLITTQKCKHHHQMLVLITSHATNFRRRNIIRDTWGHDPLKDHPRWLVMFLIGRPDNSRRSQNLLSEIQKFDDMIVGNVDENFYQLTYKVQLGFEWSVRYCSYDFLLKSDDDVFVNMPRLFNFVKDLPKKEIYAGNVHYNSPVQRTGRYGVSKEELAKDMYPRYCSGGGYLLSRDVVEQFIPAFLLVKPISIDDAYVGILALKVGVDVLASKFFKMEENEQECQFHSQYVVVHPVKSSDCMIKLFNKSLTEVKPETEI